LVTDKETFVLFPPRVRFFQNNGYGQYINKLLKKDFDPRRTSWKHTEEEYGVMLDFEQEVHKANRFYEALTQVLREFGDADSSTALLGYAHSKGEISDDLVTKVCAIRQQKKKLAEKGIEAWMSSDWENMRKYIMEVARQ